MAERKKAGCLASLGQPALASIIPAGQEHPFSAACAGEQMGENGWQWKRPQHPTAPLLRKVPSIHAPRMRGAPSDLSPTPRPQPSHGRLSRAIHDPGGCCWIAEVWSSSSWRGAQSEPAKIWLVRATICIGSDSFFSPDSKQALLYSLVK